MTSDPRPHICDVHKQLFVNKANLVRHCRSRGHIDMDSFLYKCYTCYNRRNRQYSLNSDDEAYLVEQHITLKLDLEESTRYIHRLRVTLPILGLLDLHDEDSDKGLGVVLKYLCRKLHMEEEEAVKIMKHINDLQVMPINYLEQTCSVDQWFSITHNSVSYSNNSVS